MNHKMAYTLQAVFYMASPIFGLLSYHFCDIGNWLMTFVASGLAWIMPVLGWHVPDYRRRTKL